MKGCRHFEYFMRFRELRNSVVITQYQLTSREETIDINKEVTYSYRSYLPRFLIESRDQYGRKVVLVSRSQKMV